VPNAEIHQPHPRIWLWQAFDPSVKADLFSSALVTANGLYVVDPIPLTEPQLRGLTKSAPVAGVIVTNANHHWSAVAYSERFSVPVFARELTFPDSKPSRFTEAENAAVIGGELEVIQIDGAVAGEIVLYHPANGGTLIVGDALINFEPYGFSFLPRKYCLNEKQMRSSLRQLLMRPAERIFFAHGAPILSRATARLQQLLDGAD
jgi:glyoxylase-like metal-dependent hydrolase (beta-lactamase superfamily II)